MLSPQELITCRYCFTVSLLASYLRRPKTNRSVPHPVSCGARTLGPPFGVSAGISSLDFHLRYPRFSERIAAPLKRSRHALDSTETAHTPRENGRKIGRCLYQIAVPRLASQPLFLALRTSELFSSRYVLLHLLQASTTTLPRRPSS